MKKDILIIPDAHAKPGVNNSRFLWAGRYAAKKQPDVIVELGDWEDMPSLSSYDAGKKSYEGRRYNLDIQAAHDARAKFNQGIEETNRVLAVRHKARYNPTKVALGGNHGEGRINRAIEEDPKLAGTIGLEDLGHKAFGWEYIPYLEPFEVQGLTFCHYFTSGVMGRAIGGEMPALNLLRKQLTSCVSGHTHVWDVAHRTRPNGTRVWGLIAGCYLDKDQWEEYAGPANRMWWKGLTYLRGVKDGDFDSLETISVEQLEKDYA